MRERKYMILQKVYVIQQDNKLLLSDTKSHYVTGTDFICQLTTTILAF